MRSQLALFIGVAILTACAGSRATYPIVPVADSGVPTTAGSKTFSYTGAEQTFKVPSGVRQITIVARGAAGGSGIGGLKGAHFGRGARVYAVLPVTPGDELFVFVGGQGLKSNGGFNGGGDGGHSFSCCDHDPAGGAGGGASDLRQGGDRSSNRILVAAGGGGAGQFGWGGPSGGDFAGGDGGRGGGTDGGTGGSNGSDRPSGGGGAGGTQTAGGLGGVGGETCCPPYFDGGRGQKGSLASAGSGGHSGSPEGGAGGGGGGGYYGGGGGGGGAGQPQSGPAGAGGGGGGGSSYVEPSAIKYRFFPGWKLATSDGQIVISWQ